MSIPFSIIAANWTDADKTQMLLGVRNVGLALSRQFGGGPPFEAFKRVMLANGRFIISFTRLATSPNGGACQTTNNVAAPLEAIINCDASNIFSQYTAVHELGHVFEGRTGGIAITPGVPTYYSLMKQPPLTSVPGNFNSALLDSANQVVLGIQLDASKTPDWTRGNRGWGSAATPANSAMPCNFQEHPYSVLDSQVTATPSQTAEIREIDEAAADMFLNWVYSKIGQGGFQNTDWRTISTCTTGTPQPTERPGDARNHFMNDIVLPTLATYIPTSSPTPTP